MSYGTVASVQSHFLMGFDALRAWMERVQWNAPPDGLWHDEPHTRRREAEMTPSGIDDAFGELRSLAHHTKPVDATVWRALLVGARARAPEVYDARWLPYLSRLDLPVFAVGSGAEWEELLASLPHGVRLRVMGRATRDDVARIAACSGSERVVELDLSGALIGDEGFAILAATPWFRALRALDARKNGITDASIEVFTAAHWSALERMVLANNAITDLGVTTLARHVEAPSLAWLDVSGNRHGPGGEAELRRSPRLSGVFMIT